ncbi:MAG: hypothetical protein EA409_07300 [Saprospirales bacterium]|nr:MAG: hypothetical protein EA409_07300 [Saprospirales bacterium]
MNNFKFKRIPYQDRIAHKTLTERLILYGGFLVLIFLAAWFYVERASFMDLSFHLFLLIMDGLAIQNNRFVAVLTQLFPIAGIHLGLSLNSLMLLYSLAFPIVYLIVFFLLYELLKMRLLAIAFFLSQVFMVSDTFFWVQSELPQGLAVMFLFFGLLLKKGSNPIHQKFRNAMAMMLLIVLVFAHPLIVFPVVFLGIYFSFHKGTGSKLGLYSAAFFGMYVLKSLFVKTGYDSQAMGGLRNFKHHFPDYFSLDTQIDFVGWLVSDYYLLAIGFAVLIFHFIKSKNLMLLLFYLAFFLGYLFLINVSYAGSGAEKFYLENMYLPLGVMTLVPLVYFAADNQLFAKHFLIGVAVLFAIRLGAILSRSELYCDRVNYLRELIDRQHTSGLDKTVLSEGDVNMDLIMLSWASNYEIWLLSTMHGGPTHSLLIVNNPEEFIRARGDDNKEVFMSAWAKFNYDQLHPAYFRFENRTEAYRVLE